MDINISICTYNNGTFDVMFVNRETKEELCFSGKKKLTEEEFDLANKIAPACVWTRYKQATPDD
jgi:hypothetical protein